ncbi:hypothetical protein N9A28_05920 [Sulfurimonas sp.]|nr:hypothetical protein [Sulfurimonas sp.]
MTEKNTIYQELEALRLEVESLKKEKDTIKDSHTEEVKGIETTIKDFLEKDNISELFETIKKDYANISPVTAVGLFALGAIFARSLSRK